ncbi:hypothetical protein HOD08_00125 [bacterium]|nr:hypothetical protein [bacterium]
MSAEVNKILSFLDRKLGFWVSTWNRFLDEHFTYISSSILAFLIAMFLFLAITSRQRMVAWEVRRDVQRIARAIEQINSDCNVVEIRGGRAPVTFLSRKKVSSQNIGPLVIETYENWKGPYLEEVPKFQGSIPYELVKVEEGFVVVPGNGALLPGGFVMGKDIVLAPDKSVGQYAYYGRGLNYRGDPLVAPITFKTKGWSPHFQERTLRNLVDMFKRFSEAMPYTYRGVSNSAA